MKLSLDVGCGNRDIATVKVDVAKQLVNHENFILADAQFLPFKNHVFTKVNCYHVIEHVANPYKLIDELVRVSRLIVEIRCPYRISGYAKNREHIHYFNKSWFKQLLDSKGLRHDIYLTLDRNHELAWLPLEIHILIFKPNTLP